MVTNYQNLISGTRLRVSRVTDRNLTTEILSDKRRILTTSAFRRLQTKAQVFSLEKNAAIRSRLTHTLDVSYFGELMAEKIFEKLVEKKSIKKGMQQAFVQTVENACLLHDIGNPPFGHLGEFAIRDWFYKREKEIKKIWNSNSVRGKSLESHLNGFKYFDGNAQGIRIVTKLQWLDNSYGLNLTCTLLASIVKYLSSSPNKDKPFSHKIGFFESEEKIIKDVWKVLGLRTDPNGLPLQRHPLTFIMETADDIAYSIYDIEDAIEKHVITMEGFFEAMENEEDEIITNIKQEFYAENNKKDVLYAKFSEFTNFAIKVTRDLFVEKAVECFVNNEEKILSGEFSGSLLDKNAKAKALRKFLNGFAQEHIYTSREAIEIELSGYRIIQKILDSFLPLLRISHKEFKNLENPRELAYGELTLERKLYSLLPNKHLLAYKHFTEKVKEQDRITPEIILRTHLVVDYLSGMTDSHAVKVFDILNGISTSTSI